MIPGRSELPVSVPMYTIPGRWPRMLSPGNIDINNRKVAHNPDGSISTVRSFSIGLDDGKQLLLPSVVDGRVVSFPKAIAVWKKTGRNLGTFANRAAVDAYSAALHRQQAAKYLGG